MTFITSKPLQPTRGEPVWGIAQLYPGQGLWSEREYLALATNQLVEFDDGTIEFPPMPTRSHQLIVLFLHAMVSAHFLSEGSTGGVALVAPYKLKVPGSKFREPDVLYVTAEQNALANENFAVSAELIMEVVSPDDPDWDYVTKRSDYAAVGVPEYWIVDKAQQTVLVLRLEANAYVEHGRFGPGQIATSAMHAGLSARVDEIIGR